MYGNDVPGSERIFLQIKLDHQVTKPQCHTSNILWQHLKSLIASVNHTFLIYSNDEELWELLFIDFVPAA